MESSDLNCPLTVIDLGSLDVQTPGFIQDLRDAGAVFHDFDALDGTAIGDGEEYTFHHYHPTTLSSFFPLIHGVFDPKSGWGRKIKDERIQTKKLDDYNIKADVIKLDIQGSELMALQGAVETLKSCLCVYVEVPITPLYYGAPSWNQITRFLVSQGFTLFRVQNVAVHNDKPVDCDAMYLRRRDSRTPLTPQMELLASIIDK